ncbi:hypothetical protein [Salinarimonas ramus]|uniref:Uncharacterized protein n=1 Tax=Salinarimonas ramus TaxID=690164 RepID=A0A917VAH7_9HYPH|nr:hypothetical protein [Salinarimonas ramus]GGK55697.1 hypothetical protein GCM10011322_47920 [Salinarimonas ramus]
MKTTIKTVIIAGFAFAGLAAPALAQPVSGPSAQQEITLYDAPRQDDGFHRMPSARLDVSETGSLFARSVGLTDEQEITLYDAPQQDDGFHRDPANRR